MISFLPYIVVFLLLIIILLICYLFIYIKKKKNRLQIILVTILLILSFGIEYLYLTEYKGFYNRIDNDIRLQENQQGIKVFYANILYKNTDYNSLKEKIKQENPDIVILVEFSDEHEDEMKEFFKETYPYMNRNSRSSMLAGDVVFSKIPIENITETHLVELGSWNYSYMKVFCEECGSGVDLYVIHTAAPVSTKNFEMRNSQISKLKSDFMKNDSNDKTIIIGDFNLSPWSYYYKQLTDDRYMLNALSYQSPNYTWSLFKHKIFRSHIDQLFISQGIKISEVNIEDLVGSDHRSFTFYFK